MSLANKIDTMNDEDMGDVSVISSYEVKKSIKALEDKLKLYDMRLTDDEKSLWLREHEKRRLLREIFGEELM